MSFTSQNYGVGKWKRMDKVLIECIMLSVGVTVVLGTCAYVFGKFIFSKIFGKHKMAPVLSPNKSIEGGVGGVLGAVIIGAVYAYIFRDKLTMFANPCLAFAITSGFGALLAIIGDLAASGIKRNYDIKDYGKLIPGHGGILDRFDSVIFTAPAVYFLITFLL